MKSNLIAASVVFVGLSAAGVSAQTQTAQIHAATGLTHIATGSVKAVEPRSRTVTVAHEPVPSLEWPAMTMQFKYREPVRADDLVQGRDVMFNFVQEGPDYVITAVQAVPAGRVKHGRMPDGKGGSGSHHGMMGHEGMMGRGGMMGHDGQGHMMMGMDMCAGMMHSTIMSALREFFADRR